MVMICLATTDSTPTSMQLNSSKQDQAPVQLMPMSNRVMCCTSSVSFVLITMHCVQHAHVAVHGST